MRRRLLAAAGAVVAAAAVTVVLTHRAEPHADPGAAVYPTATAPVERRTLVARTQVAATLGYAGARTVVNQAAGTVTELPAVGRVVRQGRPLYRVDGRPVVLLYGRVPAYRSLSYGMSGRDVAELNTALAKLGCGGTAGEDRFTAATAEALRGLQHRLGRPRTGELALGEAVFLPAAARVTARIATLGGAARPGMPVLSVTSTTPVVTMDLDAGRQTQVRVRDKVTITLPDGRTTPGAVSSVGTVARRHGSTSTIGVRVTPSDPAAASGLDQAPVDVAIVTDRVRDALVVPVGALLAQGAGRYAVEAADPTGRHLVAVTTGLFDDADGLVQVSGAGLTPGRRVVVPAA